MAFSASTKGHIAKPELPTNEDGKSGKVSVVAGDIARPNGLAFSPDASKLYIVEGGTSPRSILAYDVADGGTASRTSATSSRPPRYARRLPL